MENLQSQIAYFGAFLFGMGVVALQAQKLYSQRVLSLGSKMHSSDSSIPIALLSSRYSYLRGLVFYLLVAEAVFLILSLSTVILELSLNAIGRAEMAGALSGGLKANPIVPVVASSVVIALSQVRPFSDVEMAIRIMAHKIAGIPGAIEQIKSNIKAFKVKLSQENTDETSKIFMHAKARAELFVSKLDNKKHLHDHEIDNLENTLIWIYCLYQWTLGYHGRSIWTTRSADELIGLYDSLGLEYIRIEDEIRSIIDVPDDSKGNSIDSIAVGKWRDVADSCVKLEKNLTTVLALLLNDRPDNKFPDYPLLQRLSRKALRREATKEMNVLGSSLIVSSVFATLVLASYEFIKQHAKGILRSEPPVVYLDFPFKSESVSSNPMFTAWQQWWSSGMVSLENRSDAQAQILTVIAARSKELQTALETFFPHLLIFSITAFTTLLVSRAREEDGRWPRRMPHEPPIVSTYLVNGFIAYMVAMPAYMILQFYRLVIGPALKEDLDILTDTNLIVFSDYLGIVLLTPLLCFVCAWYIFQQFESHFTKKDQGIHSIINVDQVEIPVDRKQIRKNALKSIMLPVCAALFVYMFTNVYMQGFSTGWEIPDAFFHALITYFCLFYVFSSLSQRYVRSNWPDDNQPAEPSGVNETEDSAEASRSEVSTRGATTVTGQQHLLEHHDD